MYVRYKGTSETLSRDGVWEDFHSFILGKVGFRRGPTITAVDHTGAEVDCAFVDFPGLPLPFAFAVSDLEEAAGDGTDPLGDALECILAMGAIMKAAHGEIDTDKVVSTAEIAKHLGWTVERVASAMYVLAALDLVGEAPEAKGQA